MNKDPQRDAKLSEWLFAVRDAPLDSRSTRYIPLDGSLTGDTGLRGTRLDRTLALFDVVALADARVEWQPTCQLFSGFRGTGKSTELLRLKRLLEEEGYVVLLADARTYHSLARDLTVEELMFIVAGAVGETASEELGKDARPLSGWGRLLEWLKSDVKLEAAGKLGPLELKGALRNDDAFLGDLRDALKGRLETLVRKVHAYVSEIVERARRAGGTPRGSCSCSTTWSA